ncbi:ATP-dependent DNA helicase RecG [Halocynthiibacter styelae]|uniref:ATP-dependent DNA helicase RecG n=1 Tax=Halocynthiibacter styelae TaxID=2761955 RepID=A0A8J7LNL1_9RHOB|nr:ATP-dependent DNA helicase RecG [Paenihalocynthiibacter styelae]MBI1492311.1 ATP-dependent DNA helicase RecG [Paenihalocynthiibacter styelae]
MSTRPEILFPLFADLESLPGVGPKSVANFARMGVEAPVDLLFTLPHSVVDRRLKSNLRDAEFPGVVTVEITVEEHHAPRSRGRPYRVTVTDGDESFQLVFFHARSDYIQKILPEGARRVISGKGEFFDGMVQIVHPDYVVAPDEAGIIRPFEPLYPRTDGVNQKLMAKAATAALARLPDVGEWIDPNQLAKESWPAWADAIAAAHAPEGAEDFAPTAPARLRLAYDELFAHQLTLALARENSRGKQGIVNKGNGALQSRVMAGLPYDPTGAQTRAIAEISADMATPLRMNRLLQGDVGAGKTLVAFMSLLVAVEAGGQGVLMAPTGILAQQHYEGLRDLAALAGVRLEILTGRDKGAARREKLAALASGDIDILTGTHAVFQKDVVFKNLRFAVVDEQHRFGVNQRLELGKKGVGADVLVMTATPIPRSLSLAQYGDMDVSILDEKPPGRKPIKTVLVSQGRMEEVIGHLKKAVDEGRQAYWVCPLVEESESLDLTAAEERFKLLRAAFGDGVVGLVHGQMPPDDKDCAMDDFAAGNTRILVATTVIEVGVDVPNASIMVIERAESFGLAQLHQLRGRVGRGEVESTCLLMFQPPLSKTGEERLKALRESNDGFYLSEVDLKMRGAGDVLGTAQSGLPRFRVADLEGQAGLMRIAQTDARKLLSDDPTLKSERGQAARVLLWLLRRDQAIRLISVG